MLGYLFNCPEVIIEYILSLCLNGVVLSESIYKSLISHNPFKIKKCNLFVLLFWTSTGYGHGLGHSLVASAPIVSHSYSAPLHYGSSLLGLGHGGWH